MLLSRTKPSHRRVSASVKHALTEMKCSAICNLHRALYPRKDVTTLTAIYIEELFYRRHAGYEMLNK